MRCRKVQQRPRGGNVSASLDLRRLTTPQDLFQAAAEEVLRSAADAITQRGRFTIALSGGSTPRNLYTLIAANASTTLPWDKMFFFWGDERHVPLTDPERNNRMANKIFCRRFRFRRPIFFLYRLRIRMPPRRRKPTRTLCESFLPCSPANFPALI